MLGQWDKWMVDQAFDVSSIFFLYNFLFIKILYFHFCNFIKKIEKVDWKGFCKEFCKILWKKNNTWNIRRLVDRSFVPSVQQTSVFFCRLTDFSTVQLCGVYLQFAAAPHSTPCASLIYSLWRKLERGKGKKFRSNKTIENHAMVMSKNARFWENCWKKPNST